MEPFLAAQSADPFDPAPMLILADALEEAGDFAGAAVLRGLIANGFPSVYALALESTLVSLPWIPNEFVHVDDDRVVSGAGAGNRDGHGSNDGLSYGGGHGWRDCFGSGSGAWSGFGPGYGDGYWHPPGFRRACGYGDGHEDWEGEDVDDDA